MNEIFDKLIAMIDGIEVRGAENRARIDASIEILKKLQGMITVETTEIHIGEAGKHGGNQDQQRENVSD